MKRRTSKNLINTLIVVTIVTLGGVFVWSRLTRETKAPAHLAFVADTSTSVPVNCDALVTTVKAQIDQLHIGTGSRFALITTGSSKSRYEPVLVLEADIPGNSRNIYGASRNPRDDFYNQVKTACQSFAPADGSAIFRAAEIAVEHVRSYGCDSSLNCRVLISSDLEENANAEVRRRISDDSPASNTLPPLINNNSVNVAFCGYVESTISGGPRKETSPLINGWKQLFSSSVEFRPYCDSATQVSNK